MFLANATMEEPIELPTAELEKFRKVLRLERGAPIAVLPGDGTIIRCRLEGRVAIPELRDQGAPEPAVKITIAQALPKGDRFETVLRMGTEIGVASFIAFPAERSVVRWDEKKRGERLRRFVAIVQEAAEQSFRAVLPPVTYLLSLNEVLKNPAAVVLSESETLSTSLAELPNKEVILVVGPEGGWSPAEIALIAGRGVTMGPHVMRTDTAGIAAASYLLLR